MKEVKPGTQFVVAEHWAENERTVGLYGLRWVKLKDYKLSEPELEWMPTYRFDIVKRADDSRIETDAKFDADLLVFKQEHEK